MPSASAAQHRWIGYLHSNPAAQEKSGMSQAKVDEWLHSDKGKPWAHAHGGGIAGFDMGGGIGGPTPTSSTMNPLTQGMVQRYQSMPVEKLQEMVAMLGGSPQGNIVRQVLQQKLAQPAASQTPVAQQAPGQMPGQMPQQQQPMGTAGASAQARGGKVPRRDMGGDMGMSASQATPWWTRQEASSDLRGGSGFLAGSTQGRADAVKTQAPGGSYVIPADVVAGLGEGNSLAGARIMQEAISTGPWGTPQVRQVGGHGPPHPMARSDGFKAGGSTPLRLAHGNDQSRQPDEIIPPGEWEAYVRKKVEELRAQLEQQHRAYMAQEARRAGGVAPGNMRPVMLSHGEFVVAPEDVEKIGGGDRKRGHKILDRWVMEERGRQVKKLQKLPGPVKTAA
jgi:hypothetical protein